jgi:hypothetical protein
MFETRSAPSSLKLAESATHFPSGKPICQLALVEMHIETKGVLDEDFGVAGVIDKVLQGLEDGIVEITAAQLDCDICSRSLSADAE